MRFGCCVGPELVAAAAEAGYQFVELPVAVVQPERPEAEFAPVRKLLLAGPLRPEGWHLLLPADLKVTGPSVDWPRVSRYLYTALRRISAVGGAVVTFGSGGARHVPEGFPREEAWQQLVETLRVAGTVARGCGLMIAIEPLSAADCNIITSLPEAVGLARAVDMPEVGVVPDAYHMARDGHSPFDVVDAAEWLAHVHMPPVAATAPGEVGWMREFARALGWAGYDWRVSIESHWSQEGAEIGRALASLRHCFEESLDKVHG